MVIFYARDPPDWWPYHVVTVFSNGAPQARVESVVVDNGAFTFYQRGQYPDLDVWAARIARVAFRLQQRAGEVIVVLPDRPLDPAVSIMWSRGASRRLCGSYKCMVVMHYNSIAREELEALFESYLYDVEADYYAVPLKLPTSKRYSPAARKVITDTLYQKHIVETAAATLKRLGMNPAEKLHLLAPALETIAKTWRLVRSFDTTSWTRAATQEVKRRLGTISARNKNEREQLFKAYLEKLKKLGVRVSETRSHHAGQL